MRCPDCNGWGEESYIAKGMYQYRLCRQCHGSGRVPFRRWLALRWEAWREAVYEWLTD